MGLLEWLFARTPSNVDLLPDRIWLTKAARNAGLLREINAAIHSQKPPSAVLLISHFEKSLAPLQMLADRIHEGAPITVMGANRLVNRFGLSAGSPSSQSILLLVHERHPLLSHDERILEFAEGLGFRCRIAFHLSLEDPMMRIFTGDWVKSTLTALGASEHKAIESAMVSRRIAEAQKKIETRCSTDYPAGSADEWILENCPDWPWKLE